MIKTILLILILCELTDMLKELHAINRNLVNASQYIGAKIQAAP